jgi:hypothetical protein
LVDLARIDEKPTCRRSGEDGLPGHGFGKDNLPNGGFGELWWRTDEDQATGNGSGEEELPGGGSDMLWWYGGSMRRGPLVVDLGLPVGSGMGSSAGSWIFFCFFYRFTEAGVF